MGSEGRCWGREDEYSSNDYSVHLTHLGKKNNPKQAATGADQGGQEGRSAPLSPDDIIDGNPARRGAVRQKKR